MLKQDEVLHHVDKNPDYLFISGFAKWNLNFMFKTFNICYWTKDWVQVNKNEHFISNKNNMSSFPAFRNTSIPKNPIHTSFNNLRLPIHI